MTEILGLRYWTPAMLRDSLTVRAPQISLVSSRVAETLRDVLGFPEAIASALFGDSTSNLLLVVIEPQDSARLQRRTFAGDTARRLAPWVPLAELAHARPDLLAAGLEPMVIARTVGQPLAMPLQLRSDSSEVRRLWALLDAHRNSADRDTARQLLTSSSHVEDRLTALAMLGNFDRDDAAWHALIGALLDPDRRVRDLAMQVLEVFTRHAVRAVDWAPAVPDLRLILNGAVPVLLPDVLDLLVATRVAPALAGPLLRGGGYGVLLYAGASSAPTRLPSYRFLRAISGGQDLAAPAEWRAWIAGLGQ